GTTENTERKTRRNPKERTMMEEDQINRITERILGAAIEVHRALGPGLLEYEVPGRVAPGDCSPGAPTDPYVPSRAYGSSYHELATGRFPERISNPSRTRLRDR